MGATTTILGRKLPGPDHTLAGSPAVGRLLSGNSEVGIPGLRQERVDGRTNDDTDGRTITGTAEIPALPGRSPTATDRNTSEHH